MKVIESGREFSTVLGVNIVFDRAELYQLPHQGISTQYVEQMQGGKGVFVSSMSTDELLAAFKSLNWTWDEVQAPQIK
jgi:hypothetical protein